MKIIEQAARKANDIGFDTEILSSHELKAFPKTKEQKQAFYKEVRQFQAEHPTFPIDVIYDSSQLEILSNTRRKEEIGKVGELVKQFGGFMEVENSYQLNCYMKSEGQAEVIRNNRFRWYDMLFWLGDQQQKKSPLFINVKLLYSDNKALSLNDRKKVIRHLEQLAERFYSILEVVSRTELIFHTDTEKRKEILEGFARKYNHLRVYVGEDRIQEMSVKVQLKSEESS